MEDMITKKERLMNRGNAAIFQVYGNMVESMKSDFMELLNAELYVDGNATGYTDNFHGIESIFGYTASASAAVASSETYAGIAMAAVHGTWGSTSYWSPAFFNEGVTTYSWASQPLVVARRLITIASHGNNRKGRPDVLLTDETRYNVFKDKLQSEERFIAPNPELAKAGFRNVEFDGVPVSYDEDHDATSTHALNLDHMELDLLTGQLVDGESDYDISRKAFVFSMDLFGNMRINPRYQAKSADFTS